MTAGIPVQLHSAGERSIRVTGTKAVVTNIEAHFFFSRAKGKCAFLPDQKTKAVVSENGADNITKGVDASKKQIEQSA